MSRYRTVAHRLYRKKWFGTSEHEGVALVELALASPLLMLIMLGTLDVGRLFFDYIQLRNGTNTGALYAVRDPVNVGGIRNEVTSSGNLPADTVVTVSTSGSCGSINGAGTVTVGASSTFRPIFTGFLSSFGLDSIALNASTTMRCLT